MPPTNNTIHNIAIPEIKIIFENRSIAIVFALANNFAPRTIAQIEKMPNDMSSFTAVDVSNNLELKHI